MKSTVDPSEIQSVKSELVDALKASSIPQAAALARRFLAHSSSAGSAAWLERNLRPHAGSYYQHETRIAFLRSYTVEPVAQLLGAEARSYRISPSFYFGEFNAYSQEILDSKGALKQFQPDITFLCLLARSIAPELTPFSATPSVDVENCVQRCCLELEDLANAFLEKHSGILILSTLDQQAFRPHGIATANRGRSSFQGIAAINSHLLSLAAKHPRLKVLDTNFLLQTTGFEHWNDLARWDSIGLPFSPQAIHVLAREMNRYVVAASPLQRKVLVTDLDNTLWRGIIGEDGLDGIAVGTTGSGLPHRILQRALLDLAHRGLLLAICSKNNKDDAIEVLEKHPGMLLRREHFAAIRINWEPKPQNLISIANELNVGVDSLVFLDDSAVERQLMETSLPEVLTLAVNEDPVSMIQAVYQEPAFERLALTTEDASRTAMYEQQKQRESLREQTSDVTSYLQALDIKVCRVELNTQVIERVAQLTQKTNQFNLTTKRYTVADIEALISTATSSVMAFRVTDRFGDNGIVAVAILRSEEKVCEIDSLLMSCRVISRGIESAVLYAIVQYAEEEGYDRIIGKFIPTAKNAPAADYFASHGFVKEEEWWRLDRNQWQTIQLPSWIEFFSGSSP